MLKGKRSTSEKHVMADRIPTVRAALTTTLAALLVIACATSPTGRRQLTLFPEAEMAQMGDKSYQEIQQKLPATQDAGTVAFVECVANAIIDVTGPPEGGGQWEVTVFESEQANAFALPGGNIGVYTGLLQVTENPAQLAAVIGHEIAHVTADHSNERLSTAYATQTGLQVIQVASGAAGVAGQQQIMALLGLGAQVGILLPYSRTQESEADILGLRYMAKAGFDPRESVALWQNMSRAGGEAPPEFLSTHPSNESRINQLREAIPKVLPLYQQAQASGRTPQCGSA